MDNVLIRIKGYGIYPYCGNFCKVTNYFNESACIVLSDMMCNCSGRGKYKYIGNIITSDSRRY